MDQIDSYRSNGHFRSTFPLCESGDECTPSQLSINNPLEELEPIYSYWVIAEALVYSTTFSLSQIEEVEEWLNSKYGITDEIRCISLSHAFVFCAFQR